MNEQGPLVRYQLSWRQREIAALAILALLIVILVRSTPPDEPLYRGFLIANFPQVIRTKETDRVLPSLAIDRVPNGSPAQGFYVITLSPANELRYPLNRIQVRCGAQMPAPLSTSSHEFRQGLREHCRFRLPENPNIPPLTVIGEVARDQLRGQRFFFESIPEDEILIHCQELLPRQLAKSARSFSSWVKSNCEFVTRWAP